MVVCWTCVFIQYLLQSCWRILPLVWGQQQWEPGPCSSSDHAGALPQTGHTDISPCKHTHTHTQRCWYTDHLQNTHPHACTGTDLLSESDAISFRPPKRIWHCGDMKNRLLISSRISLPPKQSAKLREGWVYCKHDIQQENKQHCGNSVLPWLIKQWHKIWLTVSPTSIAS